MGWNFDKIPTEQGKLALKNAYIQGDFQLMKKILFKHRVPSICSTCAYSHKDAGKWVSQAIKEGLI